MSSTKGVPLFINRFCLSPRTAVGVQTLRLLDPYPDWLHFHWWSNELKQLDSRSVLFENTVLSRYSFLHNARFVRWCEAAGISSWTGSELRPSIAKRVRDEYHQRVSSIYLAPLGEWDAQRCLKLADLIGVPFVLHLWDVLEGDVTTGALRELIDRAEQVFCVSEPLLRDVAAICPNAELLVFSRDEASVTATVPHGEPLRVVMHGNISSYAEGLDVLDEALALLDQQNVKVEVTFLGSPKILRQARTTIKKRVRVGGFSATQEQLDLALSQAHVAFLPGPKLDPTQDLRSRYSIPSRVLDYMAVHLPIVGTVHHESATGGFLRNLGLGESVGCTTPQQVADWLQRLARPQAWAEQSGLSRNAFEYLQSQEPPAQRLKRTLEKIA